MKTIFFILLLAVTFLEGCNSDECEPVNNGQDTPVNTTGYVELDLKNKETIRLWCRANCSFEAIGDAQYTIESQNTSIAIVSVTDKLFRVRTVNSGKTNLIIRDNLGNETVLKCNSRSFSGLWSETTELDEVLHYKNVAMVDAEDEKFAEKIRTELKPFVSCRNYLYEFIEGSNELLVLIPGRGTSWMKGTYTWEIETSTLTLNYGGRSERFTCDLQPVYPNVISSINPRFIIALQQDFTKEYALKYPDAGVKSAYIIRYIISVSDYWLVVREDPFLR